jgi:L-asparaginase
MSTPAANPDNLPWAPLYSVLRSERLETTVYGLAFVWAEDKAAQNNSGLALLRVGQTREPLWSRSLLKPFQLMVLYPTLKTAYPQLTPAHYAMLMASHQNDDEQLRLLREIMAIGNISESALQCPACSGRRSQNPTEPSPLHHPCSGKHLAHLLYLKARNLSLDAYLNADQEPYVLLRELLCYLLYVDELPESVDGCGMPNLALSAVELGQLYHALISPVSRDMIRQCPDELTDSLTAWDEIADIMQKHPELIGGAGRLDSRLMQHHLPGQNALSPLPKIIAKEGADGLLCVAIGPNAKFRDGLGILLKLASGHQAAPLETVIRHVLAELGLADVSPALESEIIRTEFHFTVQEAPQLAC